MFVSIGGDVLVDDGEIIGFFDLDNATVSKRTRNSLEKAQKSGQVINTAADLPKSFVICAKKRGENRVFLSQFSPQTLLKRINYKDLS